MSDDKALIEAAVKQINEDSKYSTQRDYDNLMDSVERVLFTETPFNIADAATTVLAILADRLKDQKSSAASEAQSLMVSVRRLADKIAPKG